MSKELPDISRLGDLLASAQPLQPKFDYRSPIADLQENMEENWASAFFKKLVAMINEFNERLDKDHEVGMRLVSFGNVFQFHVRDIGYSNPSLIRFFGELEDGSPVELIQHVSQISFAMVGLKRANPDEPKTPFGFPVPH